MATILLYLVSCIFISYWHHVSYTTPTSATSKDQNHSVFIERVGMVMTNLQRYYIWTATTMDIIIYIASYHLSNPNTSTTFDPYAKEALSLLCPSPSPAFGAITLPFIAGTILVFLGTELRKACYRTMGEMYTFQHITRAGHSLCTRGPYAYVRHPGYSALVLLTPGMLLCLLAPGGRIKACGILKAEGVASQIDRFILFVYATWLITTTLALMLRAFREDNMLQKKFGPEWEAYRKATPWKFVPFMG